MGQYEAERRCLEAELQLAVALALQLEKKLKLIETLNEIVEALTKMEAEAAETVTRVQKELAPLLPPEMQMAPLRQDFSVAGTGGTSGLGAAPPMSRAEKLAIERTQAEAAQRRQQAAEKTAALAATPVQTGPTQEEKRARSEHLKLQRALLVEKKNRERQA